MDASKGNSVSHNGQYVICDGTRTCGQRILSCTFVQLPKIKMFFRNLITLLNAMSYDVA